MTRPYVAARGVDHARLATHARRFGALRYAERTARADLPFLHTFLLTAFGNPIAYLAAMGIGLGALVQADVEGVRYLWFIAPAMLVSTVVTTASMWGTWPIMSGFKWQKHYLAALATPLSPGQVALGEAVQIGVRVLIQGAIFWVVGMFFGAWSSGWSWLVVPIGALAGLAMFAPLAAYAVTVKDEGIQFNLINRLIVMPLFLFSGTFFPLSTLPPYLQWIGWVSPIWHGTQLGRVAAYGAPLGLGDVVGHTAVLVVLVVVGLLVARRNFARRALS